MKYLLLLSALFAGTLLGMPVLLFIGVFSPILKYAWMVYGIVAAAGAWILYTRSQAKAGPYFFQWHVALSVNTLFFAAVVCYYIVQDLIPADIYSHKWHQLRWLGPFAYWAETFAAPMQAFFNTLGLKTLAKETVLMACLSAAVLGGVATLTLWVTERRLREHAEPKVEHLDSAAG